MSNRPTGEEIRQAKKFLLNKKLKIQILKPNLFAIASKELSQNYDKTLQSIRKAVKHAEDNRGNLRGNKES
jgi:flagellar motor protein MotB